MPNKNYKLFSPEWIVFLFIISFVIFTPNAYYFTFDKNRIFEVGIIYLNLIILLNKNFRGHLLNCFNLFSLTTRLTLFFILILGILSSVNAALSYSAFLELCLYTGLFLVTMTVFCLSFTYKKNFANILIFALITSSVMYQTNFFGLYFAALNQKIPIIWPLPFTGFANIRFFNQYHLWLFFLLSYPLLDYKELDPRLRTSLKILAIGWAVLLFYSASRGALIAIISSLFVSCFLFRRQAFHFIKLNVFFLVAGALVTWFLFNLLPLFLGSELTSGWRTLEQLVADSPRLYLINLAICHIKAHPILGIGPMHFAYYPNPIISYSPNPIYAHPHNSIMQWAAEMGLPSTVLLASLIVKGLFLWVKRFNNLTRATAAESSSLWVVLFTTVISLLIYSLVDGVIVMPTSQVLMATVIGWMFGLYFQTNKEISIVKDNLFIVLYAGILLITLTYTIMPGLMPRLMGIENTSTREHSKSNDPHFWVQGQIPD